MRLSAIIALVLLFSQSGQTEPSVSPYIDRIRNQLPQSDSNPGSYTKSIKKTLSPSTDGHYIDDLRKARPDLMGKPGETPSYTQEIKSGLAPKSEGGAIQSVLEGKDELHPRIIGDIHYAAGIRVGASLSRNYTANADTGGNSFDAIYSQSTPIDLGLFAEYQPYHSEWYGNFGIQGQFGFQAFKGVGQFLKQLQNPTVPGTYFPLASQTTFQFIDLPVSVGLDYRFNFFRILRPFIYAGPQLVIYYENRSDGGSSHRANSLGMEVAAGTGILLDWISKKASWNLYEGFKIQHSYLTFEYIRTSTFTGPVDLSSNGLVAGLAFEY